MRYTKTRGVVLVTILLDVLSGCSNGAGENQFVGYVEADWVYIAAPQSGKILETSIKEGSEVKAGQILAILESQQQQAQLAEATARATQAKALAGDLDDGARPSEIRALEAQLKQAQASLIRAEKERNRILPLVTNGIESQNRGEQVEANYTIARASVAAATEAINVARLAGRDQAKLAAASAHQAAQAAQAVAQLRLDERTVRSLSAGRVEEVFYKPGEFVAAGSPLVALSAADGVKVHFFVPQDKLRSIDLGQTVNITADGADTVTSATITYIASSAEFTPPVIYSAESRGKLVFAVEALLPAATDLKPGLPVDIEF